MKVVDDIPASSWVGGQMVLRLMALDYPSLSRSPWCVFRRGLKFSFDSVGTNKLNSVCLSVKTFTGYASSVSAPC